VVLVVTIGAGALFGMVGLTLAAPLTSAAMHISNELRQPQPQPEPEPNSDSAVVDMAPAPSG
jgi:predicted PurR-regulated permease PerM